MATPLLNYAENTLNFRKFQNPHKNSNLITFWAFLVSIFIYISVFYAFNLSPSSLIYTPKFWFIISNTLILIIAADFTANKNHRDFYDEYRINGTRPATNVSSYEIQYEKINTPEYRETQVYEEFKAPEKIIGVVENKSPDISETSEKPDKPAKKVRNSSREKLNVLVGNKRKNVLRKTSSERYDNVCETNLEENEYSRMSDEELNKRVEDFIRRFNRQIRLQAIKGS